MANPIIVQKIHGVYTKEESSVLDVIEGGNVFLIINTPTRGGASETDGFKIRRSAIERGIPCITNIRTAIELLKAMKEVKESEIEVERLAIGT